MTDPLQGMSTAERLTAGAAFERLLEVMRQLRGPAGCAWDREQTLASLRPFVLGECYELLDAIDRDDSAALREELGDVLFELIFLARIAEETGRFGIAEAITDVTAKLIRRHPHVFGPTGEPLPTAGEALDALQVKQRWEDLKAAERQATPSAPNSMLAGVPHTLPALLRAHELSARAAAVGFDWPTAEDVVAKVREELTELTSAVASNEGAARVEEELGDVLFSLVNHARKLGLDAEAALRGANRKFQRRFEHLEHAVRESGDVLGQVPLADLERHWQEAKRRER